MPNNPVLPVLSTESPIAVMVGGYQYPGDSSPVSDRSAAGREVLESMRLAGLDPRRVLMVNAVACEPKYPFRPRELKAATVACRPLLHHYLDRAHPDTPTLVMGKVAQMALAKLGKKESSITASRGFIDDTWRIERGTGNSDELADETEDGSELGWGESE